jgi:hypothetical protein
MKRRVSIGTVQKNTHSPGVNIKIKSTFAPLVFLSVVAFHHKVEGLIVVSEIPPHIAVRLKGELKHTSLLRR